jgi:hypothetical protein
VSRPVPFAREIAAICRAEAKEIESYDAEGLAVLENLCRLGNEPIYQAYQALSEHRAFDRWLEGRDRTKEIVYLRELARCVERGEPSDFLLYPGLA